MSDKLNLKWEDYHKDHVPFNQDENRERRREYDRLRRIVNNRLQAIAASPFSEGQIFKYYSGRFDKTARQLSDHDLKYALYEAARFVKNDYGVQSFTIDMNKHIKQMVSRGIIDKAFFLKPGAKKGLYQYDAAKYMQFVNFMERNREKYKNQFYDSKQAARWFTEIKDEQYTRENLAEKFDEFQRSERAKFERRRGKAGDDSNKARRSSEEAEKRRQARAEQRKAKRERLKAKNRREKEREKRRSRWEARG